MASTAMGYFVRRGQSTRFLSQLGDYAVAAPSSHMTSAGTMSVSDRGNTRALCNQYVTVTRKRARYWVGLKGTGNKFGLVRPSATIVLNGAINFVPVSQTLYKIRGVHAGSYQSWTSNISPFVSPPSGDTVTEISHVKSTG